MRFLSYLALVVLIVSSVSAQEQTKKLVLDAKGIESVEIDCGAGFLSVRGDENLSSIEVEAEIFVRGLRNRDFEDFVKDHLDLSLEKHSNSAVLIARFDNDSRSRSRWWGRMETRVDLTVRVPYKMNLFINDGSGNMEVEQIQGEVTIDDGSGELDIRHIKGDVSIDDGSGDLRMDDIVGNMRIDDRSGEIDVLSIQGDLDIDDSSGSIYARDIQGSVVVRDGSGSIDIRRVEKDVVIREDGSGGVTLHDIKGKVTRRDW